VPDEITVIEDTLWQRMVASRRLVIVCIVLTAVGFAGWGVNFALRASLGGYACGTVPTPGRFFVQNKYRHETPVDEGTWLACLFLEPATQIGFLLAFFCFGFLILRHLWLTEVVAKRDVPGKRSPEPAFRVFLKFGLIFYLVLLTLVLCTVTCDLVRSWQAYAALK